MPKKLGTLPDHMIEELIYAKFILGANKKNINPASLDLSVDKIFRLERTFLPSIGEPIQQRIRQELNNDVLKHPLERDVYYLAKLKETLSLPETVYGRANPKSSSGRNDLHVRLMADGVQRYDTLPRNYKGDLWHLITPKSYPVMISEGETLGQIRLFNQDTRLDEYELEIAFKKHNILWNVKEERPFDYEELKTRDGDGSIILTVDLHCDGVAGYKFSGLNKILDLSKRNEDPGSFYEDLGPFSKGFLRLKKGGFYILSCLEAVRVPPELACEMVPMDERSGEFRSHYAGFIDPGWGYGKSGEGKGRQLTLEVRPYEDIYIEHGQPMAKIFFDKMADLPKANYDCIGTSNYEKQHGPTLAKQFKKDQF